MTEQERWTIYVCERHGRVEPWYEGPSSPRAGEPRCAACVNEADHVTEVAPLVPKKVVPVVSEDQDEQVWTIHELTPGPDPGSLAAVIIEGPAVSMDGEPVEVVPRDRALTAERQRDEAIAETSDATRELEAAESRVQELEGEVDRAEKQRRLAVKFQADRIADLQAAESRLARAEEALEKIAETSTSSASSVAIARAALTHSTPPSEDQ